jgi:hypothetical protein
MPENFLAALERARTALGFHDHVPAGTDPDQARRIPRRAAVNTSIDMNAPMPRVHDSAQQSVQAAAAGFSRCIAAGAALVAMPSSVPLRAAGSGVVAMAEEPQSLEIVNPAPFALISVDEELDAPEGEVTETPPPILRAAVNRATMPQFAFATSITRSAQKEFGLARIEAQLMQAIAMGMGRVFDSEILRAVAATTPETATSAQALALKAAAAGLLWPGLRGIIGTSAAANSVSVEAGVLRALGVPAELSADTAAAYVADWRGAAIFVPDAIDVIIDRTSAAGDLRVTCWLGAAAVVADPSRFFVAA